MSDTEVPIIGSSEGEVKDKYEAMVERGLDEEGAVHPPRDLDPIPFDASDDPFTRHAEQMRQMRAGRLDIPCGCAALYEDSRESGFSLCGWHERRFQQRYREGQLATIEEFYAAKGHDLEILVNETWPARRGVS